MRKLGNIVWFLFLGGFFAWLLWLLASLLAFVSIVGIPWGRACYNLSELSAAPFGKEAISRQQLTQRLDLGTSILGSIGNLVWFLVLGLWMAIAHGAIGLVCCVTIIGIPFGIQHFKLAALAISPIGKAVVSKELAEEARKSNAKADLGKIRSGTAISGIKQYDDI
ncbi:YccF domain-containing protein [Trinickia sp. NRRL B-1857]|uniref:YccF domain-containing protein n=1 Tax=Trinickia sp. NRRL B-1857 TaxID=3162879 RepID=UPI003D286F7B